MKKFKNTLEKTKAMRFSVMILLAVAFVGCNEEPLGSLIEKDPQSEEETYPGSDGINYIFSRNMDDYECYRIPALLNIDDDVLLAFAEARKDNCSDTGNIDLVVKRSEDGGETWSENIVIWDDGANTCGNPAPVYDETTGEIILLATWNHGRDDIGPINSGTSIDTRRVYVIRSSDLGVSWSEPEEITQDVKLPNWRWYATGPGSGIQIKHGEHAGRLMVACDFIDDQRDGYSHVIYSDDHGQTWELGGVSPEDQTNESEVAELSDGSLMLNMRNSNASEKRRKVAKSFDGGLSWEYLGIDDQLISPIVQASLHRYSFPDDANGSGNVLLFSNPADINERRNMTVRISFDDGDSWSHGKRLHNGFAAYSDLANYRDGRAAILYETGETMNDRYFGISFETMSLEELE